jgi:hypothetical protein
MWKNAAAQTAAPETTGVVARVDDRHNVVILDVIIVPPAPTVR